MMTDTTDVPPPPGVAQEMSPGIRRLLAPNPSPMTHWGTNTYLVGTAEVVCIDPGPPDPRHGRAILDALGGARLSRILVTHAHRDHSPLARWLSHETGAPVAAFGPVAAGRSEVMTRLAAEGLAGGGEGVDAGFAPDLRLGDGDVTEVEGARIAALHTPGHFAGHLSFALDETVFTGDHVMGWASTLVSPPDGDMGAFMASCARLAARSDRLYLPGHGAPVGDPAARLAWLVAHRRSREAAILNALPARGARVAALTAAIYTETPAALLPAAERNVFAHLVDLVERNRAEARPRLGPDALFLPL